MEFNGDEVGVHSIGEHQQDGRNVCGFDVGEWVLYCWVWWLPSDVRLLYICTEHAEQRLRVYLCCLKFACHIISLLAVAQYF